MKKLMILIISIGCLGMLSGCTGEQQDSNDNSYESENIPVYQTHKITKPVIKKTFYAKTVNTNDNTSTDSGEPAHVILSADINNFVNSIQNLSDYNEHIMIKDRINTNKAVVTLTRK